MMSLFGLVTRPGSTTERHRRALAGRGVADRMVALL
jgi:hypothetical protein